MPDPCPSEADLAAFREGGQPPGPALESHLSHCDRCRTLLVWEERLREPTGIPIRPARTAWRVAAAVLLCAGIAGGVALPRMARWWRGDGALREGTWSDAAGTRIARAGEGMEAGPGGATLSFADGTRVAIAARGRVSIDAPTEGDRLRIFLAGGEVDLDVAKGAGGVLVRAPIGGARVVGTRFRASLLPGAGVSGEAALLVEVREGIVEVAGRAGSRRVGAGEYACVVSSGSVPYHGRFAPVGARWAASLAGRLDAALRDGRAEEAAVAAIELGRQGGAGTKEGEARVLDATLPVGTRVVWARLLAAWDPQTAARAAADLEGDEPDVAPIRRALEEDEE